MVLFQAGKGAGLSNVFGGTSSSDAIFGGRGPAGFLAKATTVVAIVFMVTSFTLAFMSSKGEDESLMDKEEESVVKDEKTPIGDGTTSKLQIEKPEVKERTSKIDEEKEKETEEEPETEKDTKTE